MWSRKAGSYWKRVYYQFVRFSAGCAAPDLGRIFISKLDARLQNILFSTRFSTGTPAENESATGVAMDALGNIYVTGEDLQRVALRCRLLRILKSWGKHFARLLFLDSLQMPVQGSPANLQNFRSALAIPIDVCQDALEMPKF